MQDIEYTEEQVMIRDMARDFARGEVAPHAQAWEKAGWIDDALVAKMGELGLLGMVVPEEWGGCDTGYLAYAMALEEIADGLLLCRAHHLLLHNNGWHVVRTEADYWLIPPVTRDADQKPIPMPSKSPLMLELFPRKRAG